MPMLRQNQPPCNASDVDDLVATNEKNWKIGRVFALFEMFDPPSNGQTCIDEYVEQSKNHAAHPPQDQAQQERVNASVQPRGRMR